MKPAQSWRWSLALVFILACSPPAPPAGQPPSAAETPPLELQPGDRIVAIDGVPVEKVSDVGEQDAPPSTRRPEAQASDRAVAFLLDQQSEDGGIKSQAYGVLRPGAATTALSLYALSHLNRDDVQPHREQIQQAHEFLLQGLRKHGKVAAPDGTLDYPTYGAAMWLIAAHRLQLALSAEEQRQLTDWIVQAQLTERHDVAPDSIQYGGWDLEASSGAKGDQLKGTNISITSFALESLQGSMHKEVDAVFGRAQSWTERCQNEDGGFVFHVWRRHPGNKAMWTDDTQAEAISYATPTCDGLRCLIYCGASPDDEPCRQAITWMGQHPDVEFVPGFEAKAKEYGWREGLRFYYYFTQAKLLDFLPEAEAKRRSAALRNIMLSAQGKDGSFRNKQNRMFEDDPILATNLALIVLALTETPDDSG